MRLGQLAGPVRTIAGARQTVDDDPGQLRTTTTALCDPVDVAHDLRHAIGTPGRRLGHDDHPIGSEQRVDGEQPQ